MNAEVGQLFRYGSLTNKEVAGMFITNLSNQLNTKLQEVPIMLTTQNNVPDQGKYHFKFIL